MIAFLLYKKTFVLYGTKADFISYSSAKVLFVTLSVLAPYFLAGCCGVIKPILSSTLDNIYTLFIINVIIIIYSNKVNILYLLHHQTHYMFVKFIKSIINTFCHSAKHFISKNYFLYF